MVSQIKSYPSALLCDNGASSISPSLWTWQQALAVEGAGDTQQEGVSWLGGTVLHFFCPCCTFISGVWGCMRGWDIRAALTHSQPLSDIAALARIWCHLAVTFPYRLQVLQATLAAVPWALCVSPPDSACLYCGNFLPACRVCGAALVQALSGLWPQHPLELQPRQVTPFQNHADSSSSVPAILF